MENERSIKINEGPSDGRDDPYLIRAGDRKPIKCCFNLKEMCRPVCAAFQATNSEEDNRITYFSCSRMNGTIGVFLK